MAHPKPTVNTVDLVTEKVNYTDHTGKTRTDRFSFLKKNGKIATLQFVGYKFTGNPPMYWSDDQLAEAWTTVRGLPQPTPSPKVTPIPEEEKMPTPTPKVKTPPPSGTLDDIIRQIVVDTVGDTDLIAPIMDKMSILEQAIAKIAPKITEVHLGDGKIHKVDGVQHHMFNKVLVTLSERTPTYLVGPAGTGKSTIAENASKALGLDFSSKSCSSQSTESSLLGYMSATGSYVTTEFRERFEFGGVFLLDEVDNGNPNVLTVLNSSLSNSFMAFPDGMVQRHDDFVLIATANTFGNGATAEYVGRNPLDKAFTDRFANLEIGYDNEVEEAMLTSVGLDAVLATKWLEIVRACRQNVENYGLKVIVSPRATINGAKLLRHPDAFSVREVVETTILKGAKPDQADKILAGVTL